MQEIITYKFRFDLSLRYELEEGQSIFLSNNLSMLSLLIFVGRRGGGVCNLLLEPAAFLLTYRREMQNSTFASSAIQCNRD